MDAVCPGQQGASAAPSRSDAIVDALPAAVRAAVRRADGRGTPVSAVVPSGWPQLDAQLPAGGWPGCGLTEILGPRPSVLEWRLVGPALGGVVARGQTVVVVGPPNAPHAPGLVGYGLDERHVIWIRAVTGAQRLWCTEALLRADAVGAVLV